MEFDLQPTLTGELVVVRPLRPDDFEELYRAASDPLIWEQHPQSNRHERAVFKDYFDGAIASGGAFAVIDRSSGRIIGSSRYWNLEPGSEVEIGWTFLERQVWGGPYNAELKALMIRHAFRFVERVVFVAGEDNVRSQKALQKIGATFVAKTQRPGPDGVVRHNLVFEIVRARS